MILKCEIILSSDGCISTLYETKPFLPGQFCRLDFLLTFRACKIKSRKRNKAAISSNKLTPKRWKTFNLFKTKHSTRYIDCENI
jgi:hypothetical protein